MALTFELVPVADQQDHFKASGLGTFQNAPTANERQAFITHLSTKIRNLGQGASIWAYLQTLTQQARDARLQTALQGVANIFYAVPNNTGQRGSSQYCFALTSPDQQSTTMFQIGRGKAVAVPTHTITV